MHILFGTTFCPGISHYSIENIHNNLKNCENINSECKEN